MVVRLIVGGGAEAAFTIVVAIYVFAVLTVWVFLLIGIVWNVNRSFSTWHDSFISFDSWLGSLVVCSRL